MPDETHTDTRGDVGVSLALQVRVLETSLQMANKEIAALKTANAALERDNVHLAKQAADDMLVVESAHRDAARRLELKQLAGAMGALHDDMLVLERRVVNLTHAYDSDLLPALIEPDVEPTPPSPQPSLSDDDDDDMPPLTPMACTQRITVAQTICVGVDDAESTSE